MSTFTSFLRRLFAPKTGTALPRVDRLQVESLEDRVVPAGLDIRSYDGTGNNLLHVSWGSANTDFIRIAPTGYSDGVSSPAGATRPSARAVSNAVSDQGSQDIISDRMLSAMVYAWGQFIDHDLDSTNAGTAEAFNIAVPKGDPYFDPTGTGTKTISMSRSAFDSATGTNSPRQQVNGITSWLDGSMIYGSDAKTAASLRSGIGGQLKTSAGNLLPVDAAGNFYAGDSRVNENPELTSIQTLFMREHNRIASQISRSNPRMTDEQIFQQARAWVVGEVQSITFNEWLPTVLGQRGMKPYAGYNPNVNPSISNEFSTAGFRVGHSMLGNDIEFLGNNGSAIAPGVDLKDAFFNPALVKAHGISPILKYLSSDPMSEIDTKVVDGVRNFLFGAPGSGGFDLAALNIQRGRDHGLADYNTTRAAYGLPKVTSFAQITSDPAAQAKLQQLYGSVDNIDLWVGGLAENHVPGGSVGITFQRIIADQFERTRAADRFWYQSSFTGMDRQALDNTRLSDIIARDSDLTTVQRNAFVFTADISGTVFNDMNKDGKLNKGEQPLPGKSVELVNSDGEVVSVSKTDGMGRYHFGVADGVRTGDFTVRIAGGPSKAFHVTSGDTDFRGIDLGLMAPPPRR